MEKKLKNRGLSSLKKAGSILQETEVKFKEHKIEFSTENNIPFAFTIDKNLVLFIKELVLFQITSSIDNYHYNESAAVREGINILKLEHPIERRPDEIINPTKRGRGNTLNKEIVKVNTSFLISESDREYIYDYIYNQQKSGGRFTKEEFLILVVDKLEQKYNFKKRG
jgi:hypothetical protein